MRHRRPTSHSPAASRNTCVKPCQPRPTRQRRKGCLTRTRPEIVQPGNDAIPNLAHPRGRVPRNSGVRRRREVEARCGCRCLPQRGTGRSEKADAEVIRGAQYGRRQATSPLRYAVGPSPLETQTATDRVRPGRVRPGARHGSYEKPGAGTCMRQTACARGELAMHAWASR